MPLLASPNRGYADWQRVENWDTGLLINQTIPSGSNFYQSSVLDVSRSAYLSGYIGVTPGDATIGFTWYDDLAGDNTLGYRQYNMSSSINNVAQLRIPNMSPFCQVTASKLGAFNYGASLLIWGTNRYHPLELIPREPVLLAHAGIALAASGTNRYYPSDYYAGPVQVNAFCGQSYQLFMEWLSDTDTWTSINNITGGTGTIQTVTMLAPPGAWRVGITNQTATATTESIRITPTYTGSS